MASEKPQVTLLGWTMSEGQRDALVDGPDGPGLFSRAGFATPEKAAERYGRTDGWKLVSIMIGIIEQAAEKQLCIDRAGESVSFGNGKDDDGQLGYLVRLQKAADAAGLELAKTMVGSLVEEIMLQDENNPTVDWVRAHKTLDKVIAFFMANGVDLPKRPAVEPSSKGNSNGEPEGYPAK